MSLPEPNFIDRDSQAITAELIAQYEALTGKTLYPAQVERLLIDVIAYRETVVRLAIQEAAKQNLVAYARAPMLDYLGDLVGVTRLPAAAAKTTLRFSVTAALDTNLIIPAATRVDGGDGAVTFATDAEAILLAGNLTIDVAATATTPGAVGNGWQVGKINSLVDSLGAVDVAVSNVTIPAGGADEESDDRLRERIKLAPESFSNAGSTQAYRFHALRAHQSIVDVAVLSPAAGQVKLYPLTDSGLPTAETLALVEGTCSADKVRPLTDQVEALAPVKVDYSITAALTVYADADSASVLAQAQEKADAYVAERAAGLGRDIVPSQIIAALSVPGVYQVSLTAPAALQAIAAHEWANCTAINLTVAGATDG